MARWASLVAVFAVLLAVPLSASAARISCESRDYHRNYCPAGGSISSARLVVQQSRSACIQGRTWGFDNRGIWVTQGCSGEFDFRWAHEPRPGPGRQIACESRNYQQNFCASEHRITRAWLVEQRSRATCLQGRTWGFQPTGIWVSSGCNGVFGIEGGGKRPNPPPVNRVTCESRNFQDAFCPVRPLISRAWLDEQRSQSNCIQGETWGFQGNGIWVSGGCSGVFAFQPQ